MHIKMKLIETYNLYFSYYRDFQIYVAALAVAGLIVATADWNASFEHDKLGEPNPQRKIELSILIAILTALALAALVI